ncbi:MAG: class I SAM-dependent methyltransferase [Myxococcota bacterium]
MSKLPVELGPVQQTLLIPLYGRAVETRKRHGLLDDPKATTIVDTLDYDFTKWDGQNVILACMRTKVYDEIAQRFLDENPTGTIVEIGCGLNTRFERIDNGRARWFELDLPDAMALRRRFFEDEPRRTMIAASVLDEDWMRQIDEAGGPFLFLSEAVIIYLDKVQVQQIVRQLSERFPGAILVTDTCSSTLTTPKASQDAMKKLSIDSWFKWACDDPGEVEEWAPGIKLLDTMIMAEVSPAIRAHLPFTWRAMLMVTPWLVRWMTRNYRINQFRLGWA